MKKFIFASAILLATMGSASALTLKSGEVIGADGGVYAGASPEVMAKLIKNAQRTGKVAGVSGKSVFVVVDKPGEDGEKDVVFINLSDLAGKNKDDIQDLVIDKVVGHLNAGTNLGFNATQIGADLDRETASAAQIAAVEAAQEAAIQNFESIVESLEGATIEQIEAVTGSTLIHTEGDCAVECTETFY